MGSGSDDDLAAYPGTPYDVVLVDHDEPSVTPALPPAGLPDGHGAVAIHAWHSSAQQGAVPPMVGIDGKPATVGFGRALVIVPAGERQIEVQDGRPNQTTVVDVAEGQVVPFEYAPSQSQKARSAPRSSGGLLDRWPGARSGSAHHPWLSLGVCIAGLVWTVVIVVITTIDGVPAVGALGAVVGLLAAGFGFRNWKAGRRPNKRPKRR